MRLRAVTEAINGSPIVDVAERFGVSRQTVTAWRKRYEAEGLDGLVDASRRPHSSPARIDPNVEALICEMRRHHRRWGARRIAYQLTLEIGDRAPVPINGLPSTSTQWLDQSARATTQKNLQTVATRGPCMCGSWILNRPGFLALLRLQNLRVECRFLTVVDLLEFIWCEVIEGAVQSALVEPVDPPHRGKLDIVDGLHRAVQERASLRYRLGLEQTNCALCQRIVVRIPDTSDRCRNPPSSDHPALRACSASRWYSAVIRGAFNARAWWAMSLSASDGAGVRAAITRPPRRAKTVS